jgi:hypothetical protein
MYGYSILNPNTTFMHGLSNEITELCDIRIAQWLEHYLDMVGVIGSNPITDIQ